MRKVNSRPHRRQPSRRSEIGTPRLATKRPAVSNGSGASEAAGSLGEWLRYMIGSPYGPDWFPVWPPDAFAVAAALLRRTGSYVGLVNGAHSRKAGRTSGSVDAAHAGERWRRHLEAVLGAGRTGKLRDACPGEVRHWWSDLMRCTGDSLEACAMNPAVGEAAANLCIASDEACGGIGITGSVDPFLATAEGILRSNGSRSFCWHISIAKLAVLGKQHTPQRGCTIRSLTHNLALYTPSEIQAHWDGPYQPSGDLEVFNLLLLPWPVEVKAGDFCVAPRRAGLGGGGEGPRAHRYFDYLPQVVETPQALVRRIDRALDIATGESDQIHGIVFPELALTHAQFRAVEELAIDRGALLIAGLRDAPSLQTNGMPVNACAIQPFGLTAIRSSGSRAKSLREQMRRVQLKHHRWCLDRSQILQYELGGRLPASFDCWERVFIGRRDINFVTLGSWLTICVLVCEDLARQDPVTEVIRAVGPNLVFALLMDGPQLTYRWPSRYASVLAEDPGSSVLSLTSLGMSRRSRPGTPTAPNRSSTVALWRDAIFGEREIALGEGHDACVLSLVCKTVEEFTIDGRGDSAHAHFPVYAGAFSFNSGT